MIEEKLKELHYKARQLQYALFFRKDFNKVTEVLKEINNLHMELKNELRQAEQESGGTTEGSPETA